MRTLRLAFATLFAAATLVSTAWAVDGVVLIDQNRALAGNVTPNDAPGFPVSITQPGSYRLSGNLTAGPGASGIVILASNVTLDLNGFMISGPLQPCPGFVCVVLSGVRVPFGAALKSVTVRNGTIAGFGSQLVIAVDATRTLVEDLILNGPAQENIAGAAQSIVRHVISETPLSFFCAATLVVENVAPALIRAGNQSACQLVNNVGNII